jgi:hypothetical protein
MDLNLEDKTLNITIKKLNSPRTLEAMAILGFEAPELEAVSFEEVKLYYQKRERSS